MSVFPNVFQSQQLYAAREYGVQYLGGVPVANVPLGFGMKVKVLWLSWYNKHFAATKNWSADIVGPYFDAFNNYTTQATQAPRTTDNYLTVNNAKLFWDGIAKAASALDALSGAPTWDEIDAEASAKTWEDMSKLPGSVLGSIGSGFGKSITSFLGEIWPWLLIGGVAWYWYNKEKR
jgi:hypothetical protein